MNIKRAPMAMEALPRRSGRSFGLERFTKSFSENNSLMRNLGAFFGHIAKAIKTDPTERKVIRNETEEATDGKVILRRTTIEEIEIKRDEN